MFDSSDEALARRLEELGGLETVSPFSREFAALVVQLAGQVPGNDGARLALAGLLDVELRYHAELRELAEQAQMDLSQVRASGEKHQVGLQTVVEFAVGLPTEEPLSAAVRSLVLAECYYHLRRTAQVVDALEDVVDLGVDQPLVQFGLGYNRYVLALESCTEASETEGEIAVHDALGFQLGCLRAVGALEEGLRGEELDLQLYWWMGVILEAAGLTEAARDAYDKSAGLLAELNAEQPEREPEAGCGDDGAAASSAITDEELRSVSEMLKGRFDPQELLGEGPEEM